MRALAPVLGCLLIAAKATIACSVVQVVETLPSSPNVRLTVLKDGTPQQNATLVVSLQINAQQVGPPLRTDPRGSAELRNLAPGTYCITATADPRLGADLCLVISKGHDRERSEFSLKLAPLPPPPPTLAEQLEQAAKSPLQARARKFEGIVTDVAGASIPHAGIVVYVVRSGKEPNLIRLDADLEGRFSLPLSPGNYTAAFQSPGFKTRLVGFAIGLEESQELAPIVLQVASCT
jgi:hypothetical protein